MDLLHALSTALSLFREVTQPGCLCSMRPMSCGRRTAYGHHLKQAIVETGKWPKDLTLRCRSPWLVTAFAQDHSVSHRHLKCDVQRLRCEKKPRLPRVRFR